MHREEYLRLLQAGWSSASLERYAALRYGEDIPASTFRTYRKRCKVETPVSVLLGGEQLDSDVTPDVLVRRQELIALQTARIAIDAQHERSMGKLFSSTRSEIQLLDGLLTALKTDLQDMGVLGKAADEVRFTPIGAAQHDVPKLKSLGEVIGDDPAQQMALAKVLHMALPAPDAKKASGNGHG